MSKLNFLYIRARISIRDTSVHSFVLGVEHMVEVTEYGEHAAPISTQPAN